jgi:BMFP domain-containing protein YqiC
MPGFFNRLEEVLGSTQKTLASIEARLASLEARVNRPSHI